MITLNIQTQAKRPDEADLQCGLPADFEEQSVEQPEEPIGLPQVIAVRKETPVEAAPVIQDGDGFGAIGDLFGQLLGGEAAGGEAGGLQDLFGALLGGEAAQSEGAGLLDAMIQAGGDGDDGLRWNSGDRIQWGDFEGWDGDQNPLGDWTLERYTPNPETGFNSPNRMYVGAPLMDAPADAESYAAKLQTKNFADFGSLYSEISSIEQLEDGWLIQGTVEDTMFGEQSPGFELVRDVDGLKVRVHGSTFPSEEAYAQAIELAKSISLK